MNFNNAFFGDHVNFFAACFREQASFKHTHFGNDTKFGGSSFGKKASFNRAYFGKYTIFANEYGEDTCFDFAKFSDCAKFTYTNFIKNCSFKHAVFGKDAQFDYATFGPFAYFDDAEFHGTCIFGMKVGQKDTPEAYDLSFNGAKFYGDVHFTNRAFQPKTDFTKAEFHKLADFHGCTFHQDTSFSDADFKLPTDCTYAEDYQRAFRTLKQLMKQNDAAAEAFKFAKLEMQAKECRSISKEFPRWEWVGSKLFGWLADYGQDAKRPVIWLAIGWALAAIFYTLIAIPNNEFVNSIKPAIAHAYINVLPPISYFVSNFSKPDVDVATPFIDALKCHPLQTGIVMTFHALFSATMVFFFLLAIKRRFQIR